MSRNAHTIFLSLLALAGIGLWPFVAGAGIFGEPEAYVEGGKKHSWFSFSKPEKTTPAEQMNYAQNLLKQNETKKASKAFRSLVITWPGSAEAPMAQWALAKVLDARDKDLDAFEEYQVLMENYTGRFPSYDNIVQRQFEIATNLMARKKGGFFFFDGFEAPERAIPYLERVIQNGPRTSIAAEAQYLIGQAYEESHNNDLAVIAYITTLHRYPLSPFAEKAAFGRARVLNRISKAYPNDEDAMREAWAGIMVFLRAYPQSEFAAEAETLRDNIIERKAEQAYNIALFYDTKKNRPEAALKSYKNFVSQYPRSAWTDDARKRIVELTGIVEGTNHETN